MQDPIITAPGPIARKQLPIWNLLKVLLAVLLVAFVVSRTSLSEILALRDRISPGWAIVTFLLLVLLTFLKAFQYYLLTGRRTSYLKVSSIVVWQNALTNFVAAGAGVASYLALFKADENVKFGRAALAFLIAKVGDVFSIWLVLLICSMSFWKSITPFHQLVWLLLVGIALGLLGFFAVVVLRNRFVGVTNYLLHKTRLDRSSFFQRFSTLLDAIVGQEPGFIYGNIAIAFSLSLLYYLVTLVWMIAGMRMFAAPLEAWMVVFASGFLQLLSVIPVTIFGSLGVTEFSSLYIYSLFGVSQAVMSPVMLGWRAFFYLVNLFILAYLPLYSMFSVRHRFYSS